MEQDINTNIVHIICEYYPRVQAVYLFGSFGTEDQTAESDADIAILLEHDEAKANTMIALSDCRFALESLLKREVDFVNLRNSSTVFQNEVTNTGRRIYADSTEAVDEFEMLTLSFYQKLNEERKEIIQEFLKTKRVYNV